MLFKNRNNLKIQLKQYFCRFIFVSNSTFSYSYRCCK